MRPTLFRQLPAVAAAALLALVACLPGCTRLRSGWNDLSSKVSPRKETPAQVAVRRMEAAHGASAWRSKRALSADLYVEFDGREQLRGTLTFTTDRARSRLDLAGGATLVFDGQQAWIARGTPSTTRAVDDDDDAARARAGAGAGAGRGASANANARSDADHGASSATAPIAPSPGAARAARPSAASTASATTTTAVDTFDRARFHLLTWPAFASMPFRLRERGAFVTDAGTLPLGGRDVPVLRLTFPRPVGSGTRAPGAPATAPASPAPASPVPASPASPAFASAPAEDWYVLYPDAETGRLRAVAYLATPGADGAGADGASTAGTAEGAGISGIAGGAGGAEGPGRDGPAHPPRALTYTDWQPLDGVTLATRWTFYQWTMDQGIIGDPIGRAVLKNLQFVDTPPGFFDQPTGAEPAPAPAPATTGPALTTDRRAPHDP
ncbi:MAG TPA: hypothetical protein VER17_17045 [Tepidisphaeraceae bacterium]|nr:hypothetical protein [Tepidisphaeraceae bacterium]